jgi:LPS export ABC transporter permease LptG/LPS export ABC transporter permease LptF
MVLTFVVFTREFGRLAQLLIRKNAEFETTLLVIAHLLPSILIFTVPFAFLIGTLIGFSRLSTDSEIIAMRAGGVSSLQMIWPVFKVGLVVFFITASLTVFFLPQGNWKLRQLRHLVREIPVQSEIKPRVFYENLPGIILYVEDIDAKSSLWKRVFLADNTNKEESKVILAETGRILIEQESRRIQLHFEDGSTYTTLAKAPEKVDVSSFGTLDIPVDLPLERSISEEDKRPRDKEMGELLYDIELGPSEQAHMSLVEINRRLALPVSALIFSVLSVTFGSRAPRGGRGYGFIVSIIIAFSYYILFATGSTLSTNGDMPISLGVWGANLLLGGLALFSLRKSDRNWSWFSKFPLPGWMILLSETLTTWIKAAFSKLKFWIQKTMAILWKLPSIRFRLTRVVDLYLVRIFLLYFLTTLFTCMALVYLFTFFEIVDDVVRNGIPYSLVLEYFIFLQPHFLNLMVPISILIATLVTYGSLEKTNQLTALKSCGVSIQRLAVPVFVLALLLSGFLYVMQDYVLPFANQRQDNLRNIIKGSPIQTTQPGQRWIFGEDQNLFHYNYFHSNSNSLSGLSIFQFAPEGNRLDSMIFASNAQWRRNSQSWLLENGWYLNFTDGEFQQYEARDFFISETPDYFGEEVKASSKMTYMELQEYILDLQRGGFEVDYLRTELYKKISFPLVNFIMAVIGLPFALTMGRRGALYGIVAGVLIGIIYWGAFGIFDVLGANGFLAPSLAAWGPNIVFGSGAAILFSGVRT